MFRNCRSVTKPRNFFGPCRVCSRMSKLGSISALALLLAGLILNAQETVDDASNARMRVEALEHSLIMRTLHALTDRSGPRVTGTPNHEKAANWAVSQMTEWGLKNGHLEPWNFGHPGWLNETASARIVAPINA